MQTREHYQGILREERIEPYHENCLSYSDPSWCKWGNGAYSICQCVDSNDIHNKMDMIRAKVEQGKKAQTHENPYYTLQEKGSDIEVPILQISQELNKPAFIGKTHNHYKEKGE